MGKCGNFTSRVDNEHPADALQLFPNPTSGVIYISGVEAGEIAVFDFQGRLVMAGSVSGEELDISHLPPGMYFLHLRDGERTLVRKVIKQ